MAQAGKEENSTIASERGDTFLLFKKQTKKTTDEI